MLNPLTTADHERLSRVAALAVGAAAAATTLWLLARLLWLAVPHADTGEITPPPLPPAPQATQTIAKWHLFGNPQSVNIATIARNTPATALRLTLRGTLALPDAEDGIAMIADEQGHERGYNVGEDVTPNAKLVEVYADHVVLNHEGALENLMLPRPEQHTPELPEANRQNLAGVRPGSGPVASVPPTYVPPQMAHGALDWSKAQKQLQIDPNELARQIHAEPVYVNGKLAGARLSAGGQIGTLMAQAGLKSSDMITAVNGASVTDLSNLQRMMDNLKDASSLQVTVLRDGKPATLTVSLR
jgi:general secretion pathway protein C